MENFINKSYMVSYLYLLLKCFQVFQFVYKHFSLFSET